MPPESPGGGQPVNAYVVGERMRQMLGAQGLEALRAQGYTVLDDEGIARLRAEGRLTDEKLRAIEAQRTAQDQQLEAFGGMPAGLGEPVVSSGQRPDVAEGRPSSFMLQGDLKDQLFDAIEAQDGPSVMPGAAETPAPSDGADVNQAVAGIFQAMGMQGVDAGNVVVQRAGSGFGVQDLTGQPGLEGVLGQPKEVASTSATRGAHIRRTMLHPLALIAFAVLGAAGAVGGRLIAGATTALSSNAGLLVGLLVGVATVAVICLKIARSLAAQDFFSGYAATRGLSYTPGSRVAIGGQTPLLRRGDRREGAEELRGALPGGMQGLMMFYTWIDVQSGQDGDDHETRHPFTVAIGGVPQSADRLPICRCTVRRRFRMPAMLGDRFRSTKRVTLESEDLDRRFDIFVGPDQDDAFVRQVFTPTFIVWLSDETPEGFGWELERGQLCGFVEGRARTAKEFDELATATSRVAERLASESAE